MPSIIFCYRILFGLQRKVSLWGGEHFDERRLRPLFTQRTPPSFCSSSSPRAGLALRARPRSPGCAGAPHRNAPVGSGNHPHTYPCSNFSLFLLGVEGRGGGIKERGRNSSKGSEVLPNRRRCHLKESPCSGMRQKLFLHFEKSTQVDRFAKFIRLGNGFRQS